MGLLWLWVYHLMIYEYIKKWITFLLFFLSFWLRTSVIVIVIHSQSTSHAHTYAMTQSCSRDYASQYEYNSVPVCCLHTAQFWVSIRSESDSEWVNLASPGPSVRLRRYSQSLHLQVTSLVDYPISVTWLHTLVFYQGETAGYERRQPHRHRSIFCVGMLRSQREQSWPFCQYY